MNSRRTFLAGLLSTFASRSFAQGVAAHKGVVLPRSRPSGLPFNSALIDVAKSAGFTQPCTYGEANQKKYLLEAIGCGCAFLDFDNDGWLDVLLLSGNRISHPTDETSTRLYRNNRDGTFSDVTQIAGLSHPGWACGVCIGDYNNDGFEDIFVSYYGQNILYRNNGDGTFTNVTKQAGLPVSVKTRIGFKTQKTEEWLGFLLGQHIAALTVHARTAKELSKVPAKWDQIALPLNCGTSCRPKR